MSLGEGEHGLATQHLLGRIRALGPSAASNDLFHEAEVACRCNGHLKMSQVCNSHLGHTLPHIFDPSHKPIMLREAEVFWFIPEGV